jgi:hypothetical protein
MGKIGSDRSMSVSDLKRDSNHCDCVYRTTVLPGGTEADRGGSIHRILFQAITKALHDAQDAEISGPGEEDLEYDVALDVCTTRFVRIAGTGLIEDFERLCRRLTMGGGLARISSHGGRECRSGGCRLSGRLL